jgi:hypothetical protein
MRRAALILVLLCAACSGRPSESECGRAVDHMIDIMTAPPVGEGGAAPAEEQKASEAWARSFKDKDPTRAAMIETCRTRMTSGHVSCILAARDDVSLARCFGT